MASPKFKVFNPSGKYVAACKFAEDAAAVVAVYGAGASIRFLHNKKDTLWTDGVDGSAGDSFDACAVLCNERLAAKQAKWKADYEARWSNTLTRRKMQ